MKKWGGAEERDGGLGRTALRIEEIVKGAGGTKKMKIEKKIV